MTTTVGSGPVVVHRPAGRSVSGSRPPLGRTLGMRAQAAISCTAALIGCGEHADLPVVASGRYVEIVSDRGEPICAGTAAHFDRFVESAFAVIGETPPERAFIRYEWLAELDRDDSGGYTSRVDDGFVIRAENLSVAEHELVHAVHLAAWPGAPRFLYEGLAVLLDGRRVADGLDQPHRLPYVGGPWPADVSIDEVIGASGAKFEHYYEAWFLVGQIILDHGVAGLRELWHATEPNASAQEVRAAYQALFDRRIDDLLEPWFSETELGAGFIERRTCELSLCVGDVQTWDGDVWSAFGPVGCEDDPDAVGPLEYAPLFQETTSVAREWVMDLPGHAWLRDEEATSSNVAALSVPCWLQCADGGPTFPPGREGTEPLLTPERRRVAVGTAFDELPTDTPGAYVLRSVP